MDSEGKTIDFHISESRDKEAAKAFHNHTPLVITVEKNPPYPIAIQELEEENRLPEEIPLRQVNYLNNIVAQDHRYEF